MIRSIFPAIAAALVLLQPTVGRSQPRADFTVVPADALMMVHIKVADIWKSEAFKDVRQMIEKAGPKAFETYTKRFPINPGLIDRVTIFAIPGPADNPNRVPPPLAVIALNKPVDGATLTQFLLPNGKKEVIGKTTIHTDEHGELAMVVVGPRTLLVSEMRSVKAYLDRQHSMTGVMQKAKESAENHHLTFMLNVAALPPEATREIPPPFQPLAKAKMAGLTIDIGREIAIALGAQYPDAESAQAAEKAARDGIAMLRAKMQESKKEIGRPLLDPQTPSPAPLKELPEAAASLAGLAAIGYYDEVLDKLPLMRNDARLALEAKIPAQAGPILPLGLAAAGASAWFGLRSADAPARMVEPMPGFRGDGPVNQADLMQIGLAMHNYETVFGNLPGHAIYSKDGKTPLLSWRVAILQFMEQEELYRQFKLDEPWDSDHNKKLIAKMPRMYQSPNAPPAKEPGMTHFQMFVGGGAAWAKQARGPRFPAITDGLSNTIMATIAAEPVIWTKPDDLEYDPKKPLPKLGANPHEKLLFLMMDGAAYTKPRTLAEATLRAAISANGGEVVDWYETRRTSPPRVVPTPPAPPKSSVIPPKR
jgi:hypothetical protein